METITIEAVGKFGPKANGKWWGVKRPLKSTDFVKGETYEIETENWESNGKNGVNIVSVKKSKDVAITTNKKSEEQAVKTEVKVSSYEENKNRRILVQGITQAALVSPALAGLPFTTVNDIVNNAKEVANQMIKFVDEQF